MPFRTVGDDAAEPPFLSTIAETAESEEEFQPAGTIRPEVELQFQRTANPFHEAFDEEEVVLDPYIAAKADALADRASVYTDEQHDLRAPLAPVTAAETPEDSLESTPWAGGLPAAQFSDAASQDDEVSRQFDEIQSAIHPAAELKATEASQREPADPWRHVPEFQDSDVSPVAAVPPTAPPKLPKLSPPIPVTRLPPSLGSTGDEDMIVVDDLPRQPAPEIPKEPPPKRRHEFRQLFAKLRRE